LLRALEDTIREKYETISFNNITDVYYPFFEILLDSYKGNSKDFASVLPVFTTNYDMSIDWFFWPLDPKDRPSQKKWLDSYNVQFVDGFINQEWDSSNFNSIDENSKTKIFIPYHKLHGSLYWEKKEGAIRRNWTTSRDPHQMQELMIVYPSDKKVLTQDPYYFSHKSLDNYLFRTDSLIVIGFSFRDPAIVQAFQHALNYNHGLNIYVVNPTEISELPEEASNFLEINQDRVQYIKYYFGDDECWNKLGEVTKNTPAP
jgi:hypothetical protein